MKSMNEKGSSMIEVLSVLAVIGVLTVGILAGISKINGKIKMERTYREAKTIILKTKQVFANLRPSAITGTELVSLGIFSELDDDENSFNILGNKMTIALSDDAGNGTGEETFIFRLEGVASRDCINLMSADWGNDRSSRLFRIGIGDESFYWQDEGKEEGRLLPPSVESTNDLCTASNAVDMEWEYYY